MAQGAMVEPLAVAYHALRVAGFESGMRVVVLGAGTIGLCTLLALREQRSGSHRGDRHPRPEAREGQRPRRRPRSGAAMTPRMLWRKPAHSSGDGPMWCSTA